MLLATLNFEESGGSGNKEQPMRVRRRDEGRLASLYGYGTQVKYVCY
jgi:hypothetical protein